VRSAARDRLDELRPSLFAWAINGALSPLFRAARGAVSVGRRPRPTRCVFGLGFGCRLAPIGLPTLPGFGIVQMGFCGRAVGGGSPPLAGARPGHQVREHQIRHRKFVGGWPVVRLYDSTEGTKYNQPRAGWENHKLFLAAPPIGGGSGQGLFSLPPSIPAHPPWCFGLPASHAPSWWGVGPRHWRGPARATRCAST